MYREYEKYEQTPTLSINISHKKDSNNITLLLKTTNGYNALSFGNNVIINNLTNIHMDTGLYEETITIQQINKEDEIVAVIDKPDGDITIIFVDENSVEIDNEDNIVEIDNEDNIVEIDNEDNGYMSW